MYFTPHISPPPIPTSMLRGWRGRGVEGSTCYMSELPTTKLSTTKGGGGRYFNKQLISSMKIHVYSNQTFIFKHFNMYLIELSKKLIEV